VILNLTRRGRKMVGAVCAGLALLFAASSATAVVDRAEHASGIAHNHEQPGFSTVVVDHADADLQHADHNDTDQNEAPQLSHGVGLGHHHHMDGPPAFLNAAAPLSTSPDYTGERRAPVSDSLLRARLPAGLERPPKA